jgi:hypothetical protein
MISAFLESMGIFFIFCQNWRNFSKKLREQKIKYSQLILFSYPRCENWLKKITLVMRLNFLAICSKTNLECKHQGNMSFLGGRSAEKNLKKNSGIGQSTRFRI